MDGDKKMLGSLVLLLTSTDNDNFICRYDSHTKHHVPISTKEQLMEITKYNTRPSFGKFWKVLEKNNIVKILKVPSVTEKKKTYNRFVLNPLISLSIREISPSCYMLFRESLENVLPYKAREGLQELYDAQFTPPLDKIKSLASEPKKEMTEEEKIYIVREYLYDDRQEPAFYAINWAGNKGVARAQFTHETDLYWTPNAVSGVPGKKSQALESDIKTYRMAYIDIDAGYNEDGTHYLSDEDVEVRKDHMMEIIHALPQTTAIVKTRNGIQAYWCLYNIESLEKWKQLEMRLVNMVSIADAGVKNVNRLLRVPGSTWNKAAYKIEASGCAPYRTIIVEAERQEWVFDDLMHQLDNTEEAVKAACESYIENFGTPIEKARKNISKKSAVITTSRPGTVPSATQHADSDRIAAISNLSTETFEIPEMPTIVPDCASYIRNHINMANFLAIDNPSNFCDIFHQDNNPSATIYENGDGGWKYVCSSAPVSGMEHGLSLIDVVCELADCEPKQAVRYIAKVCNLRYEAAEKKKIYLHEGEDCLKNSTRSIA